ncbi:MAG: type II toxin-antitoxin system HipA family toxin [Prevotella sp.]|nr:type II toxin-antitoxin system HipA family toxin [Prevotella sp.]MEE0336158.1 type II toxin-antitoxin system HipA family toxin [Prevotella sp.]
MRDNIVQVSIWGKNVGLLSWDDKRGCSSFQFDRDFINNGLDIAPLVAPLSSAIVQRGFPFSGNKEKPYYGLPEFIADSLPDHWGNVVFQKWLEANNLHTRQINIVDRLSFIGKRAMGAFEFQPAHIKEDASIDIELSSLYELANRIFNDRQNVSIDINNGLIIEDLYKVGTSAGGQRPKAIIAIDETTGIIRSGQADLPQNFKHYILKFDTSKPDDFPFTKIEMAYYLMARDCGIDMMPSKLVEIEGTQNFLTQRFDRVDGIRIHTQTMAAMSSFADTYEDLFVIGRKINLTAEEQTQQYRRMVFNILAGNVDDHTKNFSFLMYPNGEWHISPAYDLIFSIDPDSRLFRNHELSVRGKRNNITRKDLIDFAKAQDIKNPANIIEQTIEVVKKFNDYAEQVGISEYWISRIQDILSDNQVLKNTD